MCGKSLTYRKRLALFRGYALKHWHSLSAHGAASRKQEIRKSFSNQEDVL